MKTDADLLKCPICKTHPRADGSCSCEGVKWCALKDFVRVWKYSQANWRDWFEPKPDDQ